MLIDIVNGAFYLFHYLLIFPIQCSLNKLPVFDSWTPYSNSSLRNSRYYVLIARYIVSIADRKRAIGAKRSFIFINKCRKFKTFRS